MPCVNKIVLGYKFTPVLHHTSFANVPLNKSPGLPIYHVRGEHITFLGFTDRYQT